MPNQHAICAARTCTRSMDMNMDMQHGHGHAAWTWTWTWVWTWTTLGYETKIEIVLISRNLHQYIKMIKEKKQAKYLGELIQLKLTVLLLGTSPKSYYKLCI